MSDGPARFHDVKVWRGTLTATARAERGALALYEGTMNESNPKARTEFDFSAFMSVDFILDDYESEPSVWRGRVTGSHYNSGYRHFIYVPDVRPNYPSWKGYAEHEWNFNAHGAMDFSGDPKVELQFHRQRGWSVRLASGRVATEVSSRYFGYTPPVSEQDPAHDYIIAENVTRRESRKAQALGMGSTGTLPYPKAGLILAASGQTKTGSFPLIGDVGLHPSVVWDYTIHLEPSSLEDLRLEIEETPAYREWRPETTADAQAGQALEVTARVVTASGAAPRVSVKSFEWELVQTSREPGVAMNYPVNATDRRLDLELDATGEFFVRENENQRVVRAVRSGFTDTVKVVPYDWGGWSTLQVTAILTNERRLVGKLKGSAETGLRVPKRAAASKIADAWKTAMGANGADGVDDDDAPVGSGVKGDGLTLYEEYRGFYQGGEHISCDPNVKDLFVRLKGTEFAAPAAEHFAAISGLNVHYDLLAEEFPASRIINANHRQGPHLVAQHGIVVRINPKLDDRFTTRGGPGRPGRITAVELCPGVDTNDNPERMQSRIAHELGHCVNIAHHGEGDPRVMWFLKEGRLHETNLVSRATGEISLVDEKNTDLTATAIADLKELPGARAIRWLGQTHGQHSGEEGCVMRYDCAKTYVLPSARNTRVTLYPENYGLGLCQSPVGTGVNDQNRNTPAPRYGPAAAGRGNCLHQIHVTDAVQAPNRTGPVKP